jgi:hypothetical protein
MRKGEVIFLLGSVNEFLTWFLYYRRGKVKFWVWNDGDSYNASASNGKGTVNNCYGSTPEAAKEVALFRLNQMLTEDPKEKELVFKGNGFALYRDK